MNFGYLLENREFIPKIFYNFDKKDIYLFFLIQFNAYVEDSIKIPLKYAYNSHSLENIFKSRIEDLISELNFSEIGRKCPVSAFIINRYKTRNFANSYTFENPKFPVAKLIRLIYFKDTPGLIFNARDFFINYVFSKIQIMHKDKKIFINDNVLYLPKSDGKNLCIVPSFSEFNRDKNGSFGTDVKMAFDMCNESRDIYLVLPRQEKLCRHIEIRGYNSYGNEKSIKVVPYSISNKIIKKRIKNENSSCLW